MDVIRTTAIYDIFIQFNELMNAIESRLFHGKTWLTTCGRNTITSGCVENDFDNGQYIRILAKIICNSE